MDKEEILNGFKTFVDQTVAQLDQPGDNSNEEIPGSVKPDYHKVVTEEASRIMHNHPSVEGLRDELVSIAESKAPGGQP